MPIAHSWQRSYAAGVDPSGEHVAPVVWDADEATALWDGHPLAAAAPLITACLGPIAEASGHLLVVSDADGTLLWIDAPPSVRLAAAEAMNFAEGAGWGERHAGTNAVGTALAVDHAVQVFAAEHFNEVVQEWTCAAAPVHDPDTDALLGVIDLTGRMRPCIRTASRVRWRRRRPSRRTCACSCTSATRGCARSTSTTWAPGRAARSSRRAGA
jgi:transcriptional regulator of acetoin/glycerol metabolism